MARKKATPKRKTIPKDPVPVEPVFEEAEDVVVEKEYYRIRYDSAMEDREFIDQGIVYERDAKTGKQVKVVVVPPIRIKTGEEKKITPEQYNYLNDKGLLLTPEKKASKDQKKNALLNVKSGREEPKKEMQIITDEDKREIFIDLPYVVE